MNDKAKPRRIQILRDTVALRIAAGEVIDRPFSVVRELIDNAVDCGAENIDLYVEGGGIDRIRVVDNGSGMSLEDLKKCYLPHATSKISEMEDLESLKTLGFRGEALSSIGACSRLEIISSETGADAGRLVVSNGALRDLSPYKGNKGTIVDVSGLFHAMPARKKFLKRPSAEAAACKKVFIDKVLPFCEISFRYFQDGAMKLFFPVSSLKERVINAYPGILNKDLTREMESSTEDFSVRIIAADPSVNRKDRRYIQLFVNNRRINDFSLLQAVEYGFSEFLPGGTYPVAFVFIDIKPSLIDVNIHPAKKEIKIHGSSQLHHAIVVLIKNFLAGSIYNYSSSRESAPAQRDFAPFAGFTEKGRQSTAQSTSFEVPVKSESFTERKTDYLKAAEPADIPALQEVPPFRYLGQVFNLFLIVEAGENIYFIDQHASHEKILFNELLENSISVQEMLVPLIFTVEKENSAELRKFRNELENMGVILKDLDNGRWALQGIPASCTGRENIIVEFLKAPKGTVKDLKTALYADMACKSAIKDGEVLDPVTAVELIKKTMKLKNARCPHGRPVWFQISRSELFNLVGRT